MWQQGERAAACGTAQRTRPQEAPRLPWTGCAGACESNAACPRRAYCFLLVVSANSALQQFGCRVLCRISGAHSRRLPCRHLLLQPAKVGDDHLAEAGYGGTALRRPRHKLREVLVPLAVLELALPRLDELNRDTLHPLLDLRYLPGARAATELRRVGEQRVGIARDCHRLREDAAILELHEGRRACRIFGREFGGTVLRLAILHLQFAADAGDIDALGGQRQRCDLRVGAGTGEEPRNPRKTLKFPSARAERRISSGHSLCRPVQPTRHTRTSDTDRRARRGSRI